MTVAVMAFIFIQSALPGHLSGAESNFLARLLARITGADPQSLSFGVRKAAHFTEYMILGGLLMVDAGGWRRRAVGKEEADRPDRGRRAAQSAAQAAGKTRLKTPLCAWSIAALYAVSDEIHQYFVPGRVCTLMDMGIDAIGAAAGVAIVYMIIRRAVRRKQ